MARSMPSPSIGEDHHRLHPPLQRGRKKKGEEQARGEDRMADILRRTVSGLSPPFAALGVLETLYDYGVTELYRLMAATAAERLGLAPRIAHLERTSVHIDGRDN
jgi:hypothetical protein